MKISRDFLHTGDVVELKTHQNYRCTFLLMDDNNLRKHKNGTKHYYYGGETKTNPSTIKVPNTGYWNVVLYFDRAMTYHLSVNSKRLRYHASIYKNSCPF